MVYKKQFKNKDAAPYQDHLYEPNINWNSRSKKLLLNDMKKGSKFNVISGFVTLFLVGAVIGLVVFDSKFGKSSGSSE